MIRVFRFLETFSDGKTVWERELRTVNSGSMLWVPVHMQPKMHSMSGAKYGDNVGCPGGGGEGGRCKTIKRGSRVAGPRSSVGLFCTLPEIGRSSC